MKRFEKESLLKNFMVFFSLLELLLILLFVELYSAEKKEYKQHLYTTMQVCSFTMKCTQFSFDFSSKNKNNLYHLYENSEISAYFPIPRSEEFLLKLIYPKKKFQEDIQQIKNILWFKFTGASLLLAFLALLFTWYTLTPIRKALNINDEFVKDILHDFNTPITAMVLNIKMFQEEEEGKNPFLQRISHSIDTIILLQNNLKSFLHHSPTQNEVVNIVKLSQERLEYIQNIYPKLTFECKAYNELKKVTNKELLIRIIDNLLSNAGKYNKRGGKVFLKVIGNSIKIQDTGKGIKNVSKVRDRYYKEQERGLGLGLSIVEKLTSELGISMHIHTVEGEGTTIILDLKNLQEEIT